MFLCFFSVDQIVLGLDFNVNVERLTPDDMDEVRSWWTKRGMLAPPDEWFSNLGLWVPHVCAVWLYATDSGKGYVDDIITNPDVPGIDRGAGLFALDTELTELASSLGIRWLVGNTQHGSMATRMELAGWRRNAEPHLIFVKEI